MDNKDEGPITTNAASGKQLRAAKKRIATRARQDKEDMCTILDLPAGRRYLWKLLSECRINGSTFAANPYLMANKSGMQDVGHRILADIVQASPEAYLLMMQENREETR